MEEIAPNAPSQDVCFLFKPKDGGSEFTRTISVSPTGAFTLSDIPKKAYDIHIKGAKWLAKNVSIPPNGDISGLTVTLSAGDVNNDNSVGLDDLGLLADAFDTQSGDSLWDERADLDCNGVVNLDDLGLLAYNFDTGGDPR